MIFFISLQPDIIDIVIVLARKVGKMRDFKIEQKW